MQGKPLKDHNEDFGHARAIERIYDLLNTSDNIITHYSNIYRQYHVMTALTNARLLHST